MYILAFKDGHDPAACLLKDGEIIAAAEEERFVRKKHAPSMLPVQAIRFCLERANIGPEQVDHLVYARLTPWQTLWNVAAYYLRAIPKTKLEWRYALGHMKVQVQGAIAQAKGTARYQNVYREFPGLPKPLNSFDHHLCHAASTFFYSGFEEGLIITMDGKGEATSVLIAEGKGNAIRVRERKGIFESLGYFYSTVTKHLGFTPNDGEYKVMGLAPYGKPTVRMDDVLRPDQERGFVIDSDYVLYPFSLTPFAKRFGQPREKESEMTQAHLDLGATAQEALEKAALSLARYAQKRYPNRNLCLAGGVALNVKMNRALWDSGLFDRLFVQPAAGDDGLVLGAAALLYTELTGKRVETLRHLYVGPEYGSEPIKQALQKANLVFHELDTPISRTVELLAQNKVVGWFQGRMEFGPRALGSRSILANPSHADMKELVNSKIKFRESFRPFCPSILAERAPDYFEHYMESPFMIISFAVKPGIAEKLPAVVHVDGTVRPQAVHQETNPLYHELISAFEQKTGLPALLNTSMNVRGEPIVCTPEDCIAFFLKTNVDAIVMGNVLVLREEQDKDLLQPMTVEGLMTEY